MSEKDRLLKQLDEAIKKESTSSENKELLRKAKEELTNAKTKNKYLEVALKIANIIGAFAKFFC